MAALIISTVEEDGAKREGHTQLVGLIEKWIESNGVPEADVESGAADTPAQASKVSAAAIMNKTACM